MNWIYHHPPSAGVSVVELVQFGEAVVVVVVDVVVVEVVVVLQDGWFGNHLQNFPSLFFIQKVPSADGSTLKSPKKRKKNTILKFMVN